MDIDIDLDIEHGPPAPFALLVVFVTSDNRDNFRDQVRVSSPRQRAAGWPMGTL